MGAKLVRGVNDLATKRPDLIRFWSPNNALGPDEVTIGSGREVEWVCKKGHHYSCEVRSRVNGKEDMCPVCSNRIVLKGFNDLKTTHPDLAAEWDPENEIKPDEVTYGSGIEVGWVCPRGHKYRITVNQRTSRHVGCPQCSKFYVEVGRNDLATKFPEVVPFWSPNNQKPPTAYTSMSREVVEWVCEKGHKYRMSIQNKTGKHQGCPFCSNRRLLKGYNDLMTTNPDIAKWWSSQNKKKASDVIAGSAKKALWTCEKGHTFEMQICNRVRGNSCPFCSNHEVLAGFNDLKTLFPEIASIWSPNNTFQPDEVLPFSHKRALFICSKGHEYEQAIGEKTGHGRGCPYCTGAKVLRGFNDLATTAPDIAAQWDFEKNGKLTPYDIMTGTSTKRPWWKCKNGHSYRATPQARCSGNGCPECAKYMTVSFPEYIVYWYLKQCNIDVDLSYKPRFLGKKEIDIYIRDPFVLAIEYDGRYYHSFAKNIKSDKAKNTLIAKQNVPLLRIREKGLPALDNCYIIQSEPKPNTYTYMQSVVEEVFAFLKKKFGYICPIDINIERDVVTIRNDYEALKDKYKKTPHEGESFCIISFRKRSNSVYYNP